MGKSKDELGASGLEQTTKVVADAGGRAVLPPPGSPAAKFLFPLV